LQKLLKLKTEKTAFYIRENAPVFLFMQTAISDI